METMTKVHGLTDEQVANVTKWVAALRSGEYEQGRGYLATSGRYCCLGVACKVGATSDSEWKLKFYLPEDAVAALGLRDNSGTFDDEAGKRTSALAYLNDARRGWDFPRIADFIEDQLATNSKRLFVAAAEQAAAADGEGR